MAVILSSNTQSEAELTAALKAAGQEIVDEPAKAPAVAQDSAQESSEQPAKEPGDAGADAGGESTAPVSETGNKQDATKAKGEGEQPKPQHDDDTLSRGKFKTKLRRAEERAERLATDLEAERGSRTKLQAELDTVKAEIAKLKGEAAPEAKADGPVRPSRPTLRDAEFDQDKYEQMLDEYDQKLDAYNAELRKRDLEQAVQAKETERAEREKAEAAERAQREFADRLATDKKAYPDWDQVMDELGDEPVMTTDTIEAYITQAENPGALLYFFAKDAAGEGNEIARFQRMSPLKQVAEVAKLEERLVRERNAATVSEDSTPAAPPTKQAERAPAQPPRKVESPIEPVGSRAKSTVDTLEAAAARGDMKAYQRLRAEQIRRKFGHA